MGLQSENKDLNAASATKIDTSHPLDERLVMDYEGLISRLIDTPRPWEERVQTAIQDGLITEDTTGLGHRIAHVNEFEEALENMLCQPGLTDEPSTPGHVKSHIFRSIGHKDGLDVPTIQLFIFHKVLSGQELEGGYIIAPSPIRRFSFTA